MFPIILLHCLLLDVGTSSLQAESLATFEKVWQTIQDKHWDLDSLQVDWQQVHETYRPLAMQAKTRDELRDVLRSMIGELGQTHFAILGGDTMAQLDQVVNRLRRGEGELGLDVRPVGGRVFVFRVQPDSPAERVGLRVGTEILARDGVSMAKVIGALNQAYGSSRRGKTDISRTLNRCFQGPYHGSCTLKIKAPGEEKGHEIELTFQPPQGESQSIGHAAAMHFRMDARHLDDGVLVLHFNAFLLPLLTQLPAVLEASQPLRGLVLDLRGNGGGLGFIASGLAGFFISEKGKRLGAMHTRDSHLNFIVVPRPKTYDIPLAVLIDETSASTSEIFAAGIRDLNRARIFGTVSAGAALPSFLETLPNGDLFQYAFADYVSVSGETIEGRGVLPDFPCPHTVEHLQAGQDAALQAAVKWIINQSEETP